MSQRMSDSVESKVDEDHAERSIEEFKRLSGQGDSSGWKFDRDEIHNAEQSSRPSAAEAGF
jgi:hypothetical protein